MATTLVNTGLKFPNNDIQTSNAKNVLANTVGGSFATLLMDVTSCNQVYRRCFVGTSDGRVRGWGYGGDENMGQQRGGDYPYPVDVGFPSTFAGATKIVTGRVGSQGAGYVIDVNGQLWAWGNNDQGQCGVGNTTHVRSPINITLNPSNSIYNKTVVDVKVPCGTEGYGHVLVRCSDGSLHACGWNGYGQCGNGNTTDRSTFVQIFASGCTDMACGRSLYEACIAVVSGTVYTWGYNGDGQLGSGNTTSTSTPTARTGGSLSGKTITKVYGQRFCLYALASDNTLHGCGNNNDGQFGVGNTTAVTSFIQIATGVLDGCFRSYDYTISAIIKTDGSVQVAGHPDYWTKYSSITYSYNQYNQVTGTTYNQENGQTWQTLAGMTGTPQKVLTCGTGNPKQIYVLMTSGVLYGYGYNGYGQLGDGTYADKRGNTPSVRPQEGTNGEANYNWGPARCAVDQIVDFACYGEGAETTLAVLTLGGEVKTTGYGGSYANANPTGNRYSSPTDVHVG